jgi:hypothetical protein
MSIYNRQFAQPTALRDRSDVCAFGLSYNYALVQLIDAGTDAPINKLMT